MAENSKIQWTHHTFNPWREPLKWNRDAAAAGERRRVFCASLADVSKERSELAQSRMRLFQLIAQTPHLDWLLLTKRPEVALENWPLFAGYWAGACGDEAIVGRVAQNYVIPNVWLGVSVEDQAAADTRIPLLLQTPAKVRFLSVEPLLGPIDLPLCFHEADDPNQHDHSECAPIPDWVIVGGESGHQARPCQIEWIRSLVAQCKSAGVACFVKQLGAQPIERSDQRLCMSWPDPETRFQKGLPMPELHGVPVLLGDNKGGNESEWPADLRIRQFPTVAL